MIECLPRLPVLGNLLDLHRDRLGLLRRVLAELGDVGAFHLGWRAIHVFSSPRHAAEILIDKAPAFEKGPMLRRFARPFMGEGMVSCLNADHARRRKAAAPAFTPRRVGGYVDQMAALASDAFAGWENGDVVPLYDRLRQLTMRMIGRTLFSIDVDADAGRIAAALDAGMEYISDRLRHPFHWPLAIPTRRNRRIRRAAAELDRFFRELCASRRREGGDRGDVLSAYLAADAEVRLDDAELVDDLKTMFFAGFETTTSALSFAWSLLATEPACLARLQAEVDGVLGDRLPRADDLPALPYTLQVIKEALRLYPPVHTLGRVVRQSVAIGEHRLPRGAIVLVCPYLVHRRPATYPDPDRFDPDRFSAAAEAARSRHDYLPFGAGARGCLGGHYAITEAQVALAVMARRYAFEHPDLPPAPETLMTLRPRGGLPLRVVAR